MSYRIEYQWAALRTTVAGEARFVIAVEGGDNNIGDARRAARRWEACMIGSARQVLKQAVGFAASCESEMLRPLGRRCSAEAYIRRIRCLVESHEQTSGGLWFPDVNLLPGHPALSFARDIGWPSEPTSRFGCSEVHVEIPPQQRELVFQLVDRFSDLRAWHLVKVDGLLGS